MSGDESGVRVVDFFRPFDGILIRSGAEVGEEAELEVVVRVDKAWQQKISGQIQNCCW